MSLLRHSDFVDEPVFGATTVRERQAMWFDGTRRRPLVERAQKLRSLTVAAPIDNVQESRTVI
jgi:hypothetical protein